MLWELVYTRNATLNRFTWMLILFHYFTKLYEKPIKFESQGFSHRTNKLRYDGQLIMENYRKNKENYVMMINWSWKTKSTCPLH